MMGLNLVDDLKIFQDTQSNGLNLVDDIGIFNKRDIPTISASKTKLNLKPLSIPEQARLANIYSISRLSGEPLRQVEQQYEGKTPETGLRRTFPIGMYREPTIKQFVQSLAHPYMTAGIGAGLATSPIPTIAGLAAGYPLFKGLEKLSEKGEELLPQKTPQELKELLGAGGYLGSLYAGGKVLGAVSKKATQAITQTPEKLFGKAINIYRDILRPTQGDIKNIEIRKGKNINDYFKVAAEEQLPIRKTSDNRLDTVVAREKLQNKVQGVHEQLNSILDKQTNQFNLKELAAKTKTELSRSVKNASELKDSITEVDKYINSEIERYGNEMVSAKEFNNIKQGMWSVAYNALRPTAKSTARKIGFTAKEMIEKSYPNENIRGLNERSGNYQTLDSLLENAQGRVIKGGRLGSYFAQGTGALIGAMLPLPGIGRAAGAVAGRWLGGKTSEFLSSPERLSNIASKKAGRALEMQRLSQALQKTTLPSVNIKPNITQPPVTPTMTTMSTQLALPYKPISKTPNIGVMQGQLPLEIVNSRIKGLMNMLPVLRRRGMINDANYVQRQLIELLNIQKQIIQQSIQSRRIPNRIEKFGYK